MLFIAGLIVGIVIGVVGMHECPGSSARRIRCLPSGRRDGRMIIWVRDDQPEMTAASDSAPDGTVSVRLGAPLPIMRLTPPITVRSLETILTALRAERGDSVLLIVSCDGADIVVREEPV